MKKILFSLSLILLFSSQALASFGFDCQTLDKQVDMYVIDYSSMLSIQSININGANIKSDQLAMNLYLGSVMGIHITDDQLNMTMLVAELKQTPSTYNFKGPATYLNSQGKKVSSEMNCIAVD